MLLIAFLAVVKDLKTASKNNISTVESNIPFRLLSSSLCVIFTHMFSQYAVTQ